MANLKLYLDSRRLKADGTALLKISVSHLRQVRYVSLGLSLKPGVWDSEHCRVTDRHPSHLRLNNAIARLKLHRACPDIIDGNADITNAPPQLVPSLPSCSIKCFCSIEVNSDKKMNAPEYAL